MDNDLMPGDVLRVTRCAEGPGHPNLLKGGQLGWAVVESVEAGRQVYVHWLAPKGCDFDVCPFLEMDDNYDVFERWPIEKVPTRYLPEIARRQMLGEVDE